MSQSVISGKRSCSLYLFDQYKNEISAVWNHTNELLYLWNTVNTKAVSEVRFHITGDEDSEVDLNGIDISLTVVLNEVWFIYTIIILFGEYYFEGEGKSDIF